MGGLFSSVRDKPVAAAVVASLVAVWVFLPPLLQVSRGVSALKTSAVLTVLYFVGWKVYQAVDRI